MDESKKARAEDILSCPRCGGKAMFIYIEENEVQSVRCASCNDLVGYT
jgi:Zn ribbon nucleic-acid-binding protein